MRRSPSKGHAALAQAIAIGGAALALVSAAWGVRVGVPRLDDERARWSALPESARDDPVAEILGFEDAVWERLRRSVAHGDRYVVLANGADRHEIRNYAAYTLLPAIQVRDPADANVVVYYRVDPPSSVCRRIGEDVCVVTRAP